MLTTIVWVLLAAAVIPLIWLWRTSHSRASVRGGLIVLSASFLWLLSGAAYAPAIGPHYSDIRLALINSNIAVVILDGIFLLLKSNAKVPTVVASGWIAFGWLYLRAVSFSA